MQQRGARSNDCHERFLRVLSVLAHRKAMHETNTRPRDPRLYVMFGAWCVKCEEHGFERRSGSRSPVLGIYAEDEVAFAQRIASGRRRVECARV
jgi:hypothetical protein